MSGFILLVTIAITIYFFTRIGVALFNHFSKRHNVHGELFVSGSGKVEIGLCHPHRPKAISVYFSDEGKHHPCHPCNPHHDRVCWDLIEDCEEYKLVINYNIGNCREIIYRVIY